MFTVEDGTGLLGANAYIETSFADTYFSEREKLEWAALTSTKKQAAIILATDYIEVRFGRFFLGEKLVPESALSFPRTGISDYYDGLPLVLKKACAEYAYRVKDAPLAPDPEFDDTGYILKGRSVRVGPIIDNVFYSTTGSSQQRIVRPYPEADLYLAPLSAVNSARSYR